MSRKIAWVTDSTIYLDEELKSNPDVYCVPMIVCVGEEQYEDGIDITMDDLFEKMRNSSLTVTTSQPSPGQFITLFKKLEEGYDEIVGLFVSSDLSGTFSSAKQAVEHTKIPVHIIDSRILSYPLTKLLKYAISLREKEIATISILEQVEQRINQHETYVLIGDLKQLHRSGRMSGTQFYLGSLLKIKPVISVADGKLSVIEKARSEKRAQDFILNKIRDARTQHSIKEVAILYSLNQEKSLEFQSYIKQQVEEIEVHLLPLCTTIAVHTGEDVVGISWVL
ncbi:DegV family protein [Metabacillus herbersteinensis]|uniref:DegV family protein n=1 Tax=Metabacillus herbersteinensis TaxID=283816 RepID=A0ABV6GDE1_9BACI